MRLFQLLSSSNTEKLHLYGKRNLYERNRECLLWHYIAHKNPVRVTSNGRFFMYFETA
jgi:hypothetical protein